MTQGRLGSLPVLSQVQDIWAKLVTLSETTSHGQMKQPCSTAYISSETITIAKDSICICLQSMASSCISESL